MRASSLQLDSSVLTRVHVEANPNAPKETAAVKFSEFSEAGLTSEVEFGPDHKEPGRYFVMLTVKMPGTEAVPAPYILDIQILGVFNCNQSEKTDDLVSINGPAVLYGSVRELVMQITSRGPFPALVLPTVNFVPPQN